MLVENGNFPVQDKLSHFWMVYNLFRIHTWSGWDFPPPCPVVISHQVLVGGDVSVYPEFSADVAPLI